MKKLLKTTMKIVISFILLIAISITGSYVVNTYAAERTVVDGHSMDDNFYDGENVIANKIIYKFQKPKRFDVVTIYPYGHKHKEDIVEFTQRLATQLSDQLQASCRYPYCMYYTSFLLQYLRLLQAYQK